METTREYFNRMSIDLGYEGFEHWLDCSIFNLQADTIFKWIKGYELQKADIDYKVVICDYCTCKKDDIVSICPDCLQENYVE